jgi:cytochrome P450
MARWIRTPVPMIEDLSRRYGDCFTLRFPFQPPFVMFSHPHAIRDLFTGDPDVLHAGEANVILKSVLGANSLLLMDGERHLRERRLMMPPFHGERMRAYLTIMRDLADQTIDRWPLGRPFPIHTEMQNITLDVILRTVFGFDEGAALDRMRERLVRFTTLGTSKLGTSLFLLMPPRYARQIGEWGVDPIDIGPWKLDVSRLVPWRELARARREMDAEIYRMLADRRAQGGGEGREDVLSMLLQTRDENGRGMTDDELRDELLTLMIAGHETSATSLAWAVHRLTQHPEVVAQVADERRRVVGAGRLESEHLPKLDYLDAVIKETMRLTPIVALVGRKLKRPMRIGGHDLPAGVVAIAGIYLTHHRPDIYPDPERFDPARFVGKKPDPYEFFPFGGGVRRCLGMAFAQYEMKIVLAEIVGRVTLRAAPGEKVRIVRRGVTFAPSAGVPVIAEARA